MTIRKTAVALSAALSAAVVSLHAQQAPPTFRAAVDVVQIDVSVLDANRRPVRGLTAADFEVLEAGQPVAISGLVEIDLPEAPQPARALDWTRQVMPDVHRNRPPVDRLITIVLDDANTGNTGSWDPWVARTGTDIARGFVERLGPNDRAAVVFTFMGRSQNFTSDRAQLHAAIDSFVPRDSPSAGPPLGCQLRGAMEGCVIDALQHVADALPVTPPRRKIVVFISQGRGIPAFDNAPGGVSPIDGRTPTFDAVQKLFRTLQRANATVYSFSPAGLAVSGASNDSLRVLADQTGGRAVVSTNAPADMVEEVLEETGSYYLLAIQSSAADGRFRPLTVRARRPDLQVRARSGYFAPETESPGAPGPAALTPIERAMIGALPALDLPLATSVAAFGIPGRREALVSVVTSVTSRPAPGASAWQAEVASTAFDADWRPRAAHRQTIEVTTKGNAEAQAVDVLAGLELLPGRYELRVAADNAGSSGSVFVDVEVPEFSTAPLSASGVIVSTVDAPYAPAPRLAAALPITPTSRRAFGRDEAAEVFLRFYQGGRGGLSTVSVAMTIANVAGEELVQGSERIAPNQFGASRSTDWRLPLPTGRLGPGEYLLTVEATLGERVVTRHLRFSILP